MTAKKTVVAALGAAAFALGGCVAVPVGPDGQLLVYPPGVVPSAVPVAAGHPAMGKAPAVLHARLYPANDIASRGGVITGTVTNMMTGKGRFQLQYQGETLTGEATRQGGDEKRGMASAYGSGGMFMQCEYLMNTPTQGSGSCIFSNGAKYQAHIGG